MFSSSVIQSGNSYPSMSIPMASLPRVTMSRVKPINVEISSWYHRRMGLFRGPCVFRQCLTKSR